jgi:hypothetical protein
VRDRSVTEPILNALHVVAGVGEGIAAGVAEHVSMDRERQAGALARRTRRRGARRKVTKNNAADSL